MNALEFLQGINDISDEYIVKAKESRQNKSIFTMKNFMKLAASVACIAIIFIATSILIPQDSTLAPAETGTPVTGVMPTRAPSATLSPANSVIKISKITMINVTSRMTYSTDDVIIEDYQSLQDAQLEIFENFLFLTVKRDETDTSKAQEVIIESESLEQLKEDALYFYDELTSTQICVFDKYFQVITAGDVNAQTGIFEITTESYDFNEYFQPFFE